MVLSNKEQLIIQLNQIQENTILFYFLLFLNFQLKILKTEINAFRTLSKYQPAKWNFDSKNLILKLNKKSLIYMDS